MSDIASLIERLEKATGAIARAFAKLDRQEECWLWTGGADAKGRGRVWIDGRIQLVHRAIWSYLNGPIQPGMLLCHHCDNPRCANPFHLYVGTHADNMRDMRERRRHFSVSDPDLAREVGRRTGEKNTWVGGQHRAAATFSQSPSDYRERVRREERERCITVELDYPDPEYNEQYAKGFAEGAIAFASAIRALGDSNANG